MLNNTQERVRLTADLIEAFAGTFLSPMYDNPQPTAQFHREVWELYASEEELCGVAAPRAHAKSTAFTHVFGLANVLFRTEDYILLVSGTEEQAMDQLGDIAKELRDNEDIHREFGIDKLTVDSRTDVQVKFFDGHECRLIPRGVGQKMRGLKWHGKRPGLIICDDIEDDEQVETASSRRKTRNWFYRVLLPIRRRHGRVRIQGTILHEDSLLARLMKKNNKSWVTLLYKAHKSFDDFSDILWPEQFSEADLRAIQQVFVDNGDPAGYSQEYLNDPFDNTERYLRTTDFIPMEDEDYERPKRVLAACDFAVSKSETANRTSFTVGGQDSFNHLHFIDQYVGKWSTDEWIDILFEMQSRNKPNTVFVEDGVIWKSVSPMIYKEMDRRHMWINFYPVTSVKDKAVRGRDYQKMMRAGVCRFDKRAAWYPDFEEENLLFTGTSDAKRDDQFDSAALLAKGVNLLADLEDKDLEEDYEEENERARSYDDRFYVGRSEVTGY